MEIDCIEVVNNKVKYSTISLRLYRVFSLVFISGGYANMGPNSLDNLAYKKDADGYGYGLQEDHSNISFAQTNIRCMGVENIDMSKREMGSSKASTYEVGLLPLKEISVRSLVIPLLL
ncbi:hypothetical protein ZIOFF_045360 [Zingiber officinale]|uniref:Uncharacterized protein n=1 Tax=Zingiber officinale TaxID=94328 RepID=A0A8J5FYY6_ZINOF|nr:hypothetical protein ZIOFF_045360 [Zingiber officinale]